MLLLALVLTALAAPADLTTRLDEAIGWVESGRAKKGVPALQALDREALPPADRARLDRTLARGHLDLVDDVFEPDAAGHLDLAFAAWTRCVTEGPAAGAAACRDDAPAHATLVHRRAERLLDGVASGRPVGGAEARTRCTQLQALQPASLAGASCLARHGVLTGDADQASAAAHAAAAALPDGPLSDDVLADLDTAVAAGLDALVRRQAAFDEALQLFVATKEALADRAADLPQAERAAANLETVLDKVAPRRPAPDADADAWDTWLKTLSAAGLHGAAVTASAQAAAAHDDAGLWERIGVVRVNAAAAATRAPSPDDPAALLAAAREAFDRCLAADPDHPRCAAHKATVDAQLDRR